MKEYRLNMLSRADMVKGQGVLSAYEEELRLISGRLDRIHGDSGDFKLNISINDSFIERFSGDGICVSTPAGSTAYNDSLGGAIVDPRLNLMQVAPIAPINTVAYRSFTSSILLPANDKLSIIPCDDDHRHLSIVADGFAENYEDIRRVELSLSRKKINLVRFEYTNFWEKAKSKFL